MRRESATYLHGGGIGAVLWAIALLLPQTQQAEAQSAAMLPHLSSGQGGNPAAAKIRSTLINDEDLLRELECLALNVYWEARGEPTEGKYAVAAVTLNRAVDPAYPPSICGVVWQGAGLGRYGCQFSWVCDRYGDHPRDSQAWHEAELIAQRALVQGHPDPTGGAEFFHAVYVRPNWSATMVKVGRIGSHVYYRPSDRSGAEPAPQEAIISENGPGDERS